MYLKSISLAGFKSFAEPTLIELEPGIIAIVGPNGCGKSNTVDAVRWALGELSSRTLRSKSIVDVIFNGTRRLPASSHARVTLAFDNCDHALEMDTAEVSITRKVFRDGSSEYLINKTPCRLKDIKQLFAGTGLGDDGYSIMEGSMVEFLISAKPHERRYLFDEASGASKFYSRRDEALSRLLKIDQDLERVRDQIELLSGETKRIESQAKKAKLFERLSQRKKDLEINKLLADLKSIDKQSFELRENGLNAKHALLNQKIASLDQDYAASESLRGQELPLEEKLRKLEGDYHELIRARDVACEKLNNIENKISEKEILSANQTSEKEQYALQGEDLARELSQVKGNLEKKKNNLDEERLARFPDCENEESSRAEAPRLRSESEKIKKEIAALEIDLVELRNQSLRLTAELSELEIELKHILKDHHREDVNRLRIEGSLKETDTRLDTLEKEIEELDQKNQVMNTDQKTKANQISALEVEILEDIRSHAALKARLEQWQRSWEKKPEIRGSLFISEVTREWGSVKGPIGKLLKIAPQHRGYLQEILGEKLNWFLADNEETAIKAIRRLASEKQGRATFVLANKIENLEQRPPFKFGSSGPGRVLDLDQILASSDPQIRQAVAYLAGPVLIQGSIIYGDTTVRGGEESRTSEQIPTLNIAQERENLIASIGRVEKSRALKETALENLAKEKENLNDNLAAFSKELEGKRLELAKLGHEKETLERDIAITRDSIGALEKDAREHLALSATKKEQSLQLEKSLKEMELTLKSYHESLTQAESALNAIELKANREKETQLSRKLAIQEALGEATVLEERSIQIQKSLAMSKAHAGRLEKSLLGVGAEISSLRSQKEKMRLEVKELEKTREDKGKSLEKLQKDLQDLKNSIAAVETLIEGKEAETGALKEEVFQDEMRLKALELEKTRLHDEMCRVFGVATQELSQKIAHFSENPPTEGISLKEGETLQGALQKVNEQIDRLGQINFLAAKEYERLREKISFLETQREDILKAKGDIETAINKTNAQIEESFRVTFNAVRDKFREIFSHFFEGGEADLVLTDHGENLSQKGIDIFAQPPGKKLQGISLLSQGEKALTVVSLLFAFFAIKPAPVCILDEIDAPLDEANILRFRKMVERFSEKCQFLIITHNKKTMEAAKALYGVTMEELGVSKIISVKLEEIAAAV